MAGDLASPTLPLLCRSIPAVSNYIYTSLSEADCFCVLQKKPSINHLMYFMLPTSVCILLKINFPAFYAWLGYIIFLLLVFCKFLEPIGVLHWRCSMVTTVVSIAVNLDYWIAQRQQTNGTDATFFTKLNSGWLWWSQILSIWTSKTTKYLSFPSHNSFL